MVYFKVIVRLIDIDSVVAMVCFIGISVDYILKMPRYEGRLEGQK